VARGLQFGVDARLAGELTAAARSATRLPLMVKLTPNVTDIVAIARAVEDAGADCVSAINTYVGMAIDVRRRRAVLDRESGGLSGPAIKPLALQAVWQVAGALRIPVIGIGGITTVADALEFLMAGAVAVQLGTVNYSRPQAAREIHDGLQTHLEAQGLPDLGALRIRQPRSGQSCLTRVAPSNPPAHSSAGISSTPVAGMGPTTWRSSGSWKTRARRPRCAP